MEIKVSRSQLIIVWVLAIMLVVEILGLVVLVYFSRLPLFLLFLLDSLKVLTPGMLAVNVLFLIWTVFVRGQQMIFMSWQDYLRELMRFFIFSFFITIALMLASAMLGTLFALLFERFGVFPKIKALKELIAGYFY